MTLRRLALVVLGFVAGIIFTLGLIGGGLWLFHQPARGMTVNLHHGDSAASTQSASPFAITIPHSTQATLSPETVLTINPDGTVICQQETLTMIQLQNKLAATGKSNPAAPIVLRASPQTPYPVVVAVLDTCRAAKLTNIAFATNRPDQPQ